MTQFICDCGNKSFSIHYDDNGEWMEVICFNCNKHHPTMMETILKETGEYVEHSKFTIPKKVIREP